MERSRQHVSSIELRVSDATPVAEFYEEVVGLERLGESGSTLRLGSGSKGEIVRILEQPDALEREPAEAGLFHLAIRFPSPDDFSGALHRIEQSEYPLAGASDHHVSEALYMSDPAGNGVELYADRPESEWERDESGSVVMTTDRLDLARVRARTDGEPGRSVPPETDLGHVHLEVRDLDAALGFYCGKLGMEIQARRPGAAFVSYDGYHHHVGLNTWNRREHRLRPDAIGVSEIDAQLDPSTLESVREGLDEDQEAEDGLALEDPDGISWSLAAS